MRRGVSAWRTGMFAVVAVTTGSCGTGCGGFALSSASEGGGQRSAVAAAEWFAAHGGVAGVPSSGWREDSSDEAGVVLRSGDATVHVHQGPDGTWQVDSGRRC